MLLWGCVGAVALIAAICVYRAKKGTRMLSRFGLSDDQRKAAMVIFAGFEQWYGTKPTIAQQEILALEVKSMGEVWAQMVADGYLAPDTAWQVLFQTMVMKGGIEDQLRPSGVSGDPASKTNDSAKS